MSMHPFLVWWQATPLSCTLNGVTHAFNDIWTTSDGVTCTCLQGAFSFCLPLVHYFPFIMPAVQLLQLLTTGFIGAVQCNQAVKRITYFDNWEVLGITLSVLVLFGIAVAVAYIHYKWAPHYKSVRNHLSQHTFHYGSFPILWSPCHPSQPCR